MRKYVFTLKDDQLHIAMIRTRGKKTRVLSTTTFSDATVSKLIESYAIASIDKVDGAVEAFMAETKRRAREADFVLGLDAIISRTIEVPFLKQRDLQSYIENNVSNFFTVDMDDYFYDYKIIQEIKATKETGRQLQIKLVVVPRAIIIGIDKLVKAFKLKLGRISIYPDIMQQLTRSNEAFGILDTGDQRSILNIYDEGATFIYASFDNQQSEEDFADEVEYFTDFYASRHQGEPLERLYITGHLAEYGALIDFLNDRLVSGVGPVDPVPLKRFGSKEDIIRYPGIILSQIKVREIRGESIDFSEEEALKEIKDRSFKSWHLFFLLLMLTCGWFFGYNYYLDEQIALYSGDYKDSSLYTEIQEEVDGLTMERDRLQAVQTAVIEMEGQQLDYYKVIKDLYQVIPEDMTVSEMAFSEGEVALSLANIGNTLDLLQVIIAINDTGLFEEVQISDVMLNEEFQDYDLILTVKE